MALRARLVRQSQDLERRDAERHNLALEILASAPGETSNAMLLDLSQSGMRIETKVALQVGDTLSVQLNGRDAVTARVVWHDGDVSGCEFDTRLDERVVMETLLRSPFVDSHKHDALSPSQVEEIPIGEDVDLEQFAEWHRKFQQEMGRKGSQLLGFRRAPDGTIVAIVNKVN